MNTYTASTDPAKHGSTETWQVVASSLYLAMVSLRTTLKAQGRVMPADLVWSLG